MSKKFCKKCGNEILPGQKFCTSCGAPIDDIFQEQNESVNNLQDEKPSVGQQPQSQPAFQQPQGQPMYQQPQGQPMYQQPQRQSMYQQPQGQPMYQQPQGQPMYQQPQGQPTYQQPQGQPTYQQPQGQSMYQQPQGQPMYQQPQGRPMYQQPQGRPMYQQPQGQPMYQQQTYQNEEPSNKIPTLGFVDAITAASNKLTIFDGRARRSEYWWWYLVVTLVGGILYVIPGVNCFASILIILALASIVTRRLHDVDANENIAKIWIVSGLAFSVLLAIAMLAESLYDLHSIVRSTFFEVLYYISMGVSTVIGLIVLVYTLKDGTQEENEWGPSPKYLNVN